MCVLVYLCLFDAYVGVFVCMCVGVFVCVGVLVYLCVFDVYVGVSVCRCICVSVFVFVWCVYYYNQQFLFSIFNLFIVILQLNYFLT